MRRTVLAPEYGEPPTDAMETTASSFGVVVDRDDCREVTFSGVLSPDGDVESQTRQVLDWVAETLAELGGSIEDVTHQRWFVLEAALADGARGTIHEVRGEFCERPVLPSSTMVGVASLVAEGALVELEAEAVLPDDGWETDVHRV